MSDKADEVIAEMSAAVELGRAGQTGPAREQLTALWERIGADGDPFHRCVVAHYLADLQDDPADELAWNLRALEAVDTLTDERVRQHHDSLAVRGFLPSLHLNLVEDYRRLGQLDQAREHLTRAQESLSALGEDDYGDMIRDGVRQAAEALTT
ncbi:hypothetical protein GCM10027280_02600 [Micromonospora polyrhachis]|uniref:Tetratricopeptide repeat protein n=2 Tax=Micromonospora polyrhachis TaxID=1282883 RepID=A0A7W7SMF8_9ACTN|nr:hypothetical protein [Micromonospora polyrhachis]